MNCQRCTKEIVQDTASIGTGYAIDGEGRHVCYTCCGDIDRAWLLNAQLKEKTTLYLCENAEAKYPAAPYLLKNWCGTLVIPIYGVRRGRHNITGERIDFWFRYRGNYFHGLNCSPSHQECCTVTRVKG